MTDASTVPGEVLGAAAMLGLSLWALQRVDEPLVWRQVRFPRDLRREQVEAILGQIAARRRPVVLAIDSQPGSLRFLMAGGTATIESLEAALAGVAPEVRLDPLREDDSPPPNAGVRAAWPGRWPLLRVDGPELAVAGLLGQLSQVGRGERLRLVVRLTPARPAPLPRDADPKILRMIEAKRRQPLLRTELLLGVTASPEVRARQLAQAVIGQLRSLSGERGRLRVRFLRPTAARKVVDRMASPPRWSLTSATALTPAELVAVIGWPIAAPRIPGVVYGAAPRLMPSLELPVGSARGSRRFAVSNWPQTVHQPLAQPIVGALQHTAIIGPTGSGKSALVAGLVEQDVRAGRGALVLDGKGDLIEALLARIPEHRQRDVVLLDPAAGGRQPGLGLFPPGSEPELTADLLLGTLSRLFADSWGIRTSSYLRLGLVTLATQRGACLPLLPRLFTERSFRQRLLAGVRDLRLLAAWQRFEALSDADQATQLAPVLRKLDELVGRARLRVVLGQSFPRLHFGEVLARGRIVLVRLPPGLLGGPATQLLAALLLWQFFAAVEARAALPAAKRRPFMAYVDEVAALGALPLPLEGLLERARGHGVGLTLAPQSLSQLSPSLRAAVLANVGSLVAFRLGAEEAKQVARELPEVSPEQLSALGRFEVALKLSLGPGHVTSTMTGRTLPPSDPCSDPTVVRQLAGEHFGLSLEQVDAALDERLGVASSRAFSAADDHEADEPLSVGVRRRRS